MNSYLEYRCQNCKKLLFKGMLVDSLVEVKCRACHEFSTFRGLAKDKLICMIHPCPNRISVAAAE